MSGGPFRFPRSHTPVRSVCLAVSLGLAAACFAGCALSRQPTADSRIEAGTRHLAEAPSDSARRAVTRHLLASAGLTPLAGERFTFGSPEVVAGFVPGRVPVERDTLVVVAAGGASAAVVAEAARALVEAAARNEGPERSVLVALWEPGRTAEQGLADVLAFGLWPSDAIRGVLVVNAALAPDEPPVASFATGTPDGASAAALAARIRELAARPVRSDTSAADPASVLLN